MYRSHNCGELRAQNINQNVVLSGWVQRVRDKGHLLWIMLRDKTGETQLFLEEGTTSAELLAQARDLGREYVIRIEGRVIERASKNTNIPTGDIEVAVSKIEVLNSSETPPFTIEDDTDGGEELRMQYRYLDLRRKPMRDNILLRHRMLQLVRNYLSTQEFVEIETPYLIKSTPEGARDFVVPSRMHQGQFYALPQSPQTFKQLLMISGFERYFQIVRCFRDEDFRADRQPEFTQIDCELSFVNEQDIINVFTGMVKTIFNEVKGIDLGEFPVLTYAEAMRNYGNDRPDLRYGMKFNYLTESLSGTDFPPFKNTVDAGGDVISICAPGAASYTRKQLDKLTDFIKDPRFGMQGLVWVKYEEDGSIKSSVDKFFDEETKKAWLTMANATKGDLLLILAAQTNAVQKAMSELRIEMAKQLELRNPNVFAPCWVVEFPLVEWNPEQNRFDAMHHPFTAPQPEDEGILDTGNARSRAYDMVINGMEVGGGSIRIHDAEMQNKVFSLLGISEQERENKFGFLIRSLKNGAPPHGGIAFGFDRLCAILAGTESIRDVIAFPKNNAGRDMMLDAPAFIDQLQLNELGISTNS
ncbi:MAG: aspartate--tRNA ligase [Bacteroidetes bacterium]|nr:aspartate--tRNA ligase [Bacteroidota bacterium]